VTGRRRVRVVVVIETEASEAEVLAELRSHLDSVPGYESRIVDVRTAPVAAPRPDTDTREA
jgi:hypothetical protein